MQRDPDTLETEDVQSMQQWRLHDVVGGFLSGCRVSDWQTPVGPSDSARPSNAGLPSKRKVKANSKRSMHSCGPIISYALLVVLPCE